ncbi:MAG TPA: ABC transporter substrate-binding protein/permease [Candidatus Kapabacteria bacterium]|nr:ABC transporter substrate-binding protein/permease [Candidatus Kapabacteria bacterium]
MKSIYTVLFIFLSSILFSFSKNIKWAADAEGNAPYIFQDANKPGNLIGFEVDLMKVLGRQLKLEPIFIQNQWDGLIPGLNRHDYDIAVNGLEITDEREKEILFSVPYYITHLKILVRSNEKYIKNYFLLNGKKVGALKNSLAEKVLRANDKLKTLTYEGEFNAFEDLKNGRIDAVLADAPIALYYVGWNKSLKILDPEVGEAKYGIAIRKNQKSLKDSIDLALNQIIKNGELKNILIRWNLWNKQMQDYTEDYTPSDSAPSMYNYFIESQLKDVSLEERLTRYIGFMPLILQAAVLTLNISIIAMILAVVFGLFLAIIRIYSPKPLSIISIMYIEIVRGTPLLIQLFFIFYALPSIGISLSPFVAAVLGLGLNYAAYEAENYRAGLNAVPKGQLEAALALGLNRRQSLRYIIIPQAFRIVIPPMTNDFISLLKDSSLVSVITLVELTKLYTQLSATYYDYIGTGLIIAAVYLILGLPFVNLSKYFEQKLKNNKFKS